MENPYATPVAAPLAPTQHSPKKMLWWKIFFWLLVLLQISTFIGIFSGSDALTWDVIGEMVIYIFVIAGVFGFAYRQALFTEWFWRCLVPVAALWDMFLIGQSVTGAWNKEHSFVGVIIIAVVFGPLMSFQYFALYKYAFRSNYLWATKTNRVAPE